MQKCLPLILDQLEMLCKPAYLLPAQGTQLFIVQRRAPATDNTNLFLQNPIEPAPAHHYGSVAIRNKKVYRTWK
jgi:hypothetical protein